MTPRPERLHAHARWLVALALFAGLPASGATRAERDLRATEAAVCHAFEIGDAAYLRKALDPGFTLTDSKGGVEKFAATVDEVARREPRYEMFRNHDQAVRMYGDAAVVNGITSIRGSSGGEAFSADFRFTDTWVRRHGRWILAASHASRLPAAGK